jgi:hypothetical protein
MRCQCCKPTEYRDERQTKVLIERRLVAGSTGFFEEVIMSALRKVLVVETREPWTPVVIVGSGSKASEGKAEPAAAPKESMLRNMALFLSAPFIGLLYAVLLPFVGLAMLAWFAGTALRESGKVHEALRFAKKMVLIAAAPLGGLGYLIVLPFAGLGALAWFGATALMAPAAVK